VLHRSRRACTRRPPAFMLSQPRKRRLSLLGMRRQGRRLRRGDRDPQTLAAGSRRPNDRVRAKRRAGGASGHRTRRPVPPTRRHDAQLDEDGARRELRVTEPQIASWQEQLAALAWTPRCLRPEHRSLWDPVTLRHLGIGWDGHRLTIPIRDVDGDLQGLLRYAPIATRTAKMIAAPRTRLGLIPIPPPSRRDGSCSPRVRPT
jgi:hypothetical protein